MTTGTHEYFDDPRNAAILISINGALLPREKAVVSVFDSGFVLGDGVWEGLRLIDGGIAFLDAHFDRLYEGAKEAFVTGTFAGLVPVRSVDGRTIGEGDAPPPRPVMQ